MQKRWQIFFSLEDELAQGVVVGSTPGCSTAARQSGELWSNGGRNSTGNS